MQLTDLLQRSRPPVPWQEGDNIPWNEPGFSERMLAEHLSQEHDAASRRSKLIDLQVQWIHTRLLAGRPSSVLDLGCGPGLYSSQLAQLGHVCVGIDYSPASIRYARQTAAREQLACTYHQADLREADFGQERFDLAMLIYGEFNIFRPSHARELLQKSRQALKPGGILLLEPHTFQSIENHGNQLPVWYISQSGLFSQNPHLTFSECFWDAVKRTATVRYYVLGLQDCQLTRYAQTFQAYEREDYEDLLLEQGFQDIQFSPSLTGGEPDTQTDFLALTAVK